MILFYKQTMCEYIFIKGDNVGENCKNKVLFNDSNLCKIHYEQNMEKENKENKENKVIKNNKCSYVLSRGERKGQSCGVKVSEEGNVLCKAHTKTLIKRKDPGYTTCVGILGSGLKKGQICGRKALEGLDKCSIHSKCKPVIVDPEYTTCVGILGSGLKKGQICGRKALEGLDKCSIHSKCHVTEDSNDCKYVITRGPKKGELCGKKCVENNLLCNSHNKEKPLTAKNINNTQKFNDNKCIYLYKRGKSKGSVCEKNCVNDDIMCPSHMKTDKSSDISSVLSTASKKSTTSIKKSNDSGETHCSYKITKGESKGENCKNKAKDNGFCTKHNPEGKSTASISKKKLLNEEEEEISNDVLNSVTNKLNINKCKGKVNGKQCTKTANGKSKYCMIHKSLDDENDLLAEISNNLDEEEKEEYHSEDEEEIQQSDDE